MIPLHVGKPRNHMNALKHEMKTNQFLYRLQLLPGISVWEYILQSKLKPPSPQQFNSVRHWNHFPDCTANLSIWERITPACFWKSNKMSHQTWHPQIRSHLSVFECLSWLAFHAHNILPNRPTFLFRGRLIQLSMPNVITQEDSNLLRVY